MQGLTSTSTAINSNRQMYERLSKGSVLATKPKLEYSSSQVQYYNDEKTLKKEKRKKAAKWLTLGFAGVSILSLTTTLIVQIIKGKIKPKAIVSQVKDSNAVQSALSFSEKLLNFGGNLDAAKNEGWQAISSKFHLTKFDETIRKFFEKIGKAENKKIYDKHMQRFNSYAKALGAKEIDNFDTIYENASKDIQKGITGGKKVWVTLTEGFKKTDANSTFLSRIKNGFITMWKNGSKELITDENIKKVNTGSDVFDVYQKHSKGINLPNIGDLSPNLYSLDAQTKYTARGQLIEKIQGIIEDNPEITNTAEEIADDLIELNRVLTKGMKTSIEKQRDLLMGNASVDVLGMMGSAAMLGGAVATADSKEDKEAITLDLGIPLLSSMAFSIIAGVKNIAGPVGAIIGLCFGQVVSMSVKSLETIFNKVKRNNNDLQQQTKV